MRRDLLVDWPPILQRYEPSSQPNGKTLYRPLCTVFPIFFAYFLFWFTFYTKYLGKHIIYMYLVTFIVFIELFIELFAAAGRICARRPCDGRQQCLRGTVHRLRADADLAVAGRELLERDLAGARRVLSVERAEHRCDHRRLLSCTIWPERLVRTIETCGRIVSSNRCRWA